MRPKDSFAPLDAKHSTAPGFSRTHNDQHFGSGLLKNRNCSPFLLVCGLWSRGPGHPRHTEAMIAADKRAPFLYRGVRGFHAHGDPIEYSKESKQKL